MLQYDIQIYLATDLGILTPVLRSCLFSVQEWMNVVKMKLNLDKTEFSILLVVNMQKCQLHLNFMLHSFKTVLRQQGK